MKLEYLVILATVCVGLGGSGPVMVLYALFVVLFGLPSMSRLMPKYGSAAASLLRSEGGSDGDGDGDPRRQPALRWEASTLLLALPVGAMVVHVCGSVATLVMVLGVAHALSVGRRTAHLVDRRAMVLRQATEHQAEIDEAPPDEVLAESCDWVSACGRVLFASTPASAAAVRAALKRVELAAQRALPHDGIVALSLSLVDVGTVAPSVAFAHVADGFTAGRGAPRRLRVTTCLDWSSDVQVSVRLTLDERSKQREASVVLSGLNLVAHVELQVSSASAGGASPIGGLQLGCTQQPHVALRVEGDSKEASAWAEVAEGIMRRAILDDVVVMPPHLSEVLPTAVAAAAATSTRVFSGTWRLQLRLLLHTEQSGDKAHKPRLQIANKAAETVIVDLPMTYSAPDRAWFVDEALESFLTAECRDVHSTFDLPLMLRYIDGKGVHCGEVSTTIRWLLDHTGVRMAFHRRGETTVLTGATVAVDYCTLQPPSSGAAASGSGSWSESESESAVQSKMLMLGEPLSAAAWLDEEVAMLQLDLVGQALKSIDLEENENAGATVFLRLARVVGKTEKPSVLWQSSPSVEASRPFSAVQLILKDIALGWAIAPFEVLDIPIVAELCVIAGRADRCVARAATTLRWFVENEGGMLPLLSASTFAVEGTVALIIARCALCVAPRSPLGTFAKATSALERQKILNRYARFCNHRSILYARRVERAFT